MKNNRSPFMEFLMTYGWAISAAIIVIGVLASYYKPFPFQEGFTIYKEECRDRRGLNELRTWYSSIRVKINSSSDKLKLMEEEFDRIVKEKNLTGASLDFDSVQIIITQDGTFLEGKMNWFDTSKICEQKEVDEIDISDYAKRGMYCDLDIYPKHKDYCVVGNREKDRYDRVRETKKKEDLTRDWLNKNTECLTNYCENCKCTKWQLNEFIIKVKE